MIRGLIRRRILVNYRVDPAVIRAQLPERFEPKLQDGHAIAGVCLIRLEELRPLLVPRRLGIASENAAHRVAVTWRQDGVAKEGVFIPRRDTGSALSRLAGGRVFPGEHHRAHFDVREDGERVELAMRSHDGAVSVHVRGHLGGAWPRSSCFASLSEASTFFEAGSLGYSATREPERLDGLELRTHGWSVEPLAVEEASSSWFEDEARFPRGSVELDCALLMRNVGHEWHEAEDLYL